MREGAGSGGKGLPPGRKRTTEGGPYLHPSEALGKLTEAYRSPPRITRTSGRFCTVVWRRYPFRGRCRSTRCFYTVCYTAELLAPTWAEFSVEDEEDARLMYTGRLDDVGPRTVSEVLEQARGSEPGVVLLCHERNPAHCHRSWLAAWWQAQTGHQVTELPHLARSAPPGQLSLKL